jgi:energy-coupling factor transport system ATP-binding protein
VRASVELESVTFTYPEAQGPVLDDVSLVVHEGSFVLVAGPTGAGKSTLLRTFNGLVPHFSGGEFSGRVNVEGRDTRAMAPRYMADVIAFVPQDPGSSFVVDGVEDELAYAMENVGVPSSAMRRRVEETIDLMAIAHLRDRSVRTLSGGERQRVAIAAALTLRPKILVLDEPTSQLDPQGAEDVLAALQRLVHDLSLTVVVAEHRLERVAGFVDAAIGMTGSGGVVTGDPRSVLAAIDSGPPVTSLAAAEGWEPLPLTVREARAIAPRLGPPRDPVHQDRGTGLVDASALICAYGDKRVLGPVDFGVGRGEIVALMGRNGAGKTTLLRCLAGLHAPDSGTVNCGGNEPRAGHNVALVPQVPEDVLFKDTVVAEVAETLKATDHGSSEMLERLGLNDLSHRHPRDLSAGERLLVATAAIAATGAPLLLFDEPTRGLDPEAKRRLSHVMEATAATGGAVFATHDVELAAAIATRVVMLAGGDVIADGPPATVLGDSTVFAPQMSRVFGPGWMTVQQVHRALQVGS